jgi:hypothetical protein
VSLVGLTEEQITAALEGVVKAGAKMPASGETDVILPGPIR